MQKSVMYESTVGALKKGQVPILDPLIVRPAYLLYKRAQGVSRKEVEDRIASDNEKIQMISYLVQRSEPTDYPFLSKVIEAQTASGYIIHSSFYDKMIELYEWAVPLLEKTNQHWNYANDQCWKKLQPNTKWYCFTNRCGKQRAGYSDNSERYNDYDC
jgi:hypothetical protein